MSIPLVKNSFVEGGYPDVTNSGANPRFLGSSYNLSSCSPALDFGNNSFNSSVNDLADNPRFVDATSQGVEIIDAGAFEFQNIAACPCQDHLVLTGSIASGIYEAAISITCDGIVEAGSDVILSAPDSIIFSTDFEVEEMATLETQSEGCINN